MSSLAGWAIWIEDTARDLLGLLERIADAGERIADASERDVCEVCGCPIEPDQEEDE
jgi:hypothetical protein